MIIKREGLTHRKEREWKDVDMKCTVKYLTVVVTVLMFGSVLAFGQREAAQSASQTKVEQSLTGTMTCEGRITHTYICQRNQTQQTCTLACVERGSQFVLSVDDTPYVLEGNSRKIEGFAGGKATVTGLVTRNHIQVHTVSDARQTEANARIGAQDALRADGSR
jgi:hypothetical protein